MKNLVCISIVILFLSGMAFSFTNLPNSDHVCEGKYLKNLDHTKVEKRADAVMHLADDGCREVQDRLIDMAQNEDNYAARIVAIVALTRVGDEYTVSALRDCLDVENRQTVRTVLNGAINMLENRLIASM